ncbi:MAG: DUF3859 domain-containing protein [Verrucomicrobiota bacterium]
MSSIFSDKTRNSLITVLLFGLITFTGFIELKPNKVDIIEYGVLTFESEEVVENPNTVAGTESFMDGIQWIERTEVIPAKLGVSFGVEYIIRGNPEETVQVTEVIIFPGPGLTNPKTGKSLKESPYPIEVYKNEGNIFAYTFDEPWEIAKGEWIYQLKIEGKLILEKRFQVK